MSSLKVEVVKVDDVLPHPNADRLEIAVIRGWNCIVRKDQWRPGDLGVYFPIDSVLHADAEAFLFPPESKVKLTNSRVRTIRIRGAISQGLLITVEETRRFCATSAFTEGADLTQATGTQKYEPISSTLQGRTIKKGERKKVPNPFFHKYTDIENFKNHPDLFAIGDSIVVQEKVHGTNFRAGWVPYHLDTWWKKALGWLGWMPVWEFVYGSHSLQLQDRFLPSGYDKNVYAEAVRNYDLKRRIPKGMVIYGEIYGIGVQKGYTYGMDKVLNSRPRALVAFDVKTSTGQYLNYYEMRAVVASLGLQVPPEYYVGPHKGILFLKQLVDGPSTLNYAGSQACREGIVIRSYQEQRCYVGRKMLKYKSDEFLHQFEDDTH